MIKVKPNQKEKIMSIQTGKAFQLLEESGGFASELGYESWDKLAKLSKRELIETAIRLGSVLGGECDSAEAGHREFWEEHRVLKGSRII